jgi:hypothetical protein
MKKTSTEADYNELREAFVGNMRYFHEDPVWAHYFKEIASRASPQSMTQYSNSNNQ